MMKSRSSNTRLLPTGGSSTCRCWSIHRCRLNACRGFIPASYSSHLWRGEDVNGRLMAVAGYGDRRTAGGPVAVEIDRRELTAPDATGVESDDIVAHDEAQCRPVTEHDASITRAPALDIEPRKPLRAGRRRLPFET